MKNLLSLMFLLFIVALAVPMAMASGAAAADPLEDTLALVIVAAVFVGVAGFVIWRKRRSGSSPGSGSGSGGGGGGPRPPTQQH